MIENVETLLLAVAAAGAMTGLLVWLTVRRGNRRLGASGLAPTPLPREPSRPAPMEVAPMEAVPRGTAPDAAVRNEPVPLAAPGPADAVQSELEHLVLEHMSDVVVRFDAHWRRIYVSPSCQEVFGYSVAEMLAMPAFQLVHPDDRASTRTAVASIGPGSPPRELAWRAVHRDGRVVWVEASYRSTPGNGGTVGILRDITRRHDAEERLVDALERLERLAMVDSLTGLPNRGAFMEAAGQTLRPVNDLALLFIDLDRFHPINDVHGHAAGDAVLREVAQRLNQTLAGEPMVARLGADEFGALIRVPNGDPGIAARARDLIRVVAAPIHLGAMTLDIGATIGIAVSPRDGAGTAIMLRNADLAMQTAKQAGGGAYRFFEPAMGEALERAAELKAELRGAIHGHQIVPWFHPLVRLSDMELVGYEVLARWEHPSRGVLPPDDFLQLAEETGLAAELFGALLEQACLVARAWPSSVGLSVNISPHELHDESLPGDVARILSRTGFEGTRLEVEITEHALIHDSKVARAVLEGLRELGISVALDDFGTGFSSLYHLRELPFDKVKIDRSFMRALDRDAESARYVAAIIGLGHALGLELTAEGIEDNATLARLRELGCTYGQGNVFRTPAPASEVARAPWRHVGAILG